MSLIYFDTPGVILNSAPKKISKEFESIVNDLYSLISINRNLNSAETIRKSFLLGKFNGYRTLYLKNSFFIPESFVKKGFKDIISYIESLDSDIVPNEYGDKLDNIQEGNFSEKSAINLIHGVNVTKRTFSQYLGDGYSNVKTFICFIGNKVYFSVYSFGQLIYSGIFNSIHYLGNKLSSIINKIKSKLIKDKPLFDNSNLDYCI